MPRVGAGVARGELGEVRLDHGQKPVPDPGVQPQRAGVHEPGAGRAGRAEQRFQVGQIVGHPGQHRRHDQAGVDPCGGEPGERPQPHRGERGADFHLADQTGVHRDERDVHLEVRAGGEAPQHVEVARHERAFRDDADRESLVASQPLEDRACHLEASLRRLIGVGRRADHDRRGRADRRTLGPEVPSQVSVQRAEHVLLHENALLERLPAVRPAKLAELLVAQPSRIVRPLDHVAVRVARVAVRAAELAPHVRIDGPEIHTRGPGRVEDRPGRERDELGAAETLVEDGEGGRADSRTGGR